LISVTTLFVLIGCSKTGEETSDAVLKRAFENARDGNWDKAKELAATAVSSNPESAVAETLYAIALEQCLDYDQAISEAEHAVQLDGKNFMALYIYGRLLLAAKRYDECLAPLEKANKIEANNPVVLLLLARVNAILDIRKKAVKYYIELIKHSEDSPGVEPFNELGVLFLKNNDFKHALQFLKEAYGKKEKSVPVLINLGVLFDKYSLFCVKRGKKSASKKAALKAIRYYKNALLIMRKSEIDERKQAEIIARIKVLSTRARASS
jgi:tetratricopeptide (TPR) repeat protein